MEVTCTDGPRPVTSLYEQEELALVTGGTLRPGGLALTADLLTCCRPAPDSTVLDVGCGSGHTVDLAVTVFGLRPTGLDPSAAMLAKASRLVPTASFLQGKAAAIPFEPQSFDMVISECVLCLTGDIEQSLREMHRVLRPGGKLILTDIYRKQPGIKPDLPNLQTCITYAVPLEEIENRMDTAGFTRYTLWDRSELLRQLAGQIIFSYGGLEKFWQLFMGEEAARRTCCALAAAPLGYYALIAEKGAHYG